MSSATPLAPLTLNTFLQVARDNPPDAVLCVEGNRLTARGQGTLGHRDVTWVGKEEGPALAVRGFREAVTREVSPFASQAITARLDLAGEAAGLQGRAVESLVAEARRVQQARDIELVLQGVADAERFRALGIRQTD